MSQDISLSTEDREIIALCVELLKQDSGITYREVRKKLRSEKDLGVRRQLWSAARKEAGIARDDNDLAGDGQARRPQETGRQENRNHRGHQDRRGPQRRPESREPVRRDTEEPEAPWTPDPSKPPPPWARSREHDRRRMPDSHDNGQHVERREQPSPKPFYPPARTAMEFMVQYLGKLPEASFEQVRDAAEDAGFTIYPATFGRAQATVGIIEADPAPIVRRTRPTSPPATTPKKPEPETPAQAPDIAVAADQAEAGFQVFLQAYKKRNSSVDTLESTIKKMLQVVEEALDR